MPAIPPVEAILAAVPFAFDAVEVHFVPDRLGGGPWGSRPGDPGDILMVRGEWDLPDGVKLPPLARC